MTVREVKILRAIALSPTELREATKIGDWVDPVRMNETVEALTKACQRHGMLTAATTFEVTPAGAGESIVTFVIGHCP